MNLRGLSFDAMPPLSVPFQFFITAPISIIAIGLLWLFADPYEVSSRWTNLMLASTHGITLGFMLMVMFGALFQVLPVVTGISMPQAKTLSRLVHFFLVIGVICLFSGFAFRHQYQLATGVIAMVISLLLFVGALFMRFSQMRSAPTSWAIRLASLSLVVTIALGVLFIIGWLQPEWFSGYRLWTNVHLMWGIVGWTLLLIMGVSFQIIPMFYVTPDYPKWVSHFLPPAIFIQLTLYSVSHYLSLSVSAPNIVSLQLVLLTLTVSAYALYTLYLLKQRKRKALDITIWFWNTAMVSFLSAAALFLVLIFYQGLYRAQLELLLAIMSLAGFAMALITGMLLKIVPFLVWLNIQQKWIKHPSKKMPLSNMQQVIPIVVAKRQYFLFMLLLPLLVLIFSGFNNIWLIKITACLLIVTYGYLFYNLIKAKALFNQLDAKLDSTS